MKKIFSNRIVLLLPVVIFLLGCIQPMRYTTAIEKGYEIDATVVEVKEKNQTNEDGPDTTDYITYVDYEVDGKKYEHVKAATFYEADDVYEGKVIQIVVNPNNPGKVMKEGGVLATVGFVLMLVMYIPAIIAKFKGKKKENAL